MKRAIGMTLAAATAAMVGSTGAALAQDAEAGASVFRQCQACHMVGENAMNRVGPHLNGIVGREWAAIEDFRYSDSHREAAEAQGGVWTVAVMSEYLANPRAMVPRTRMAFGGLRTDEDITNVIAYLAGFDADGNAVDPAPVLEEHAGGDM